MQYSVDQEELLAQLAETILDAFECIAHAARESLSQPVAHVDELLALNAQQSLNKIRNETRKSLSTLLLEPAIARVEVHWTDRNESERIYISRGSSAGIFPQGLQGRLVSYRAALGRLAEIPVGEIEEIILPEGRVLARIDERIQLHPRSDEAGWDSRDSAAEFAEWSVVVESLRRLIERAAR